MPIDLNALIQLIPCGEPGNVDALSGRAHVCSDRMRIAVTTCVVVPCSYCLPDTTARFIDMLFVDVLLCPDLVWEWGGINGEHRLKQDPFYGPCWYRTVQPIGRATTWYGAADIYVYVIMDWVGITIVATHRPESGPEVFHNRIIVGYPRDCLQSYEHQANQFQTSDCDFHNYVIGHSGFADMFPTF